MEKRNKLGIDIFEIIFSAVNLHWFVIFQTATFVGDILDGQFRRWKRLSQTKICSDRMQSTPQRREQSWRNTCSLSSKMSTRCWAVFVHCRRNLVQWWLNICYFRAFGDEKALYQPRSVLRTSCFQLSSSQTLVTRGCCLSLAGLCWAVISFRSCWLPRDRRSQYKMNSDVLVVLEFPWMIPYVDLETWLDDWPTAYVCFGSSFWIGVCARQLWMKKDVWLDGAGACNRDDSQYLLL
jgi:hypothetical protein